MKSMKTITKNRIYLFLFALISGLITVATVVYFNTPDQTLKVTPVYSISNLIFGKEVKNLDFQGQTFVAADDPGKISDLCKLNAKAFNTYMPIEKNSTGLYSYNNVCNDTGVSLRVQAENLPVNIDYDKTTAKLSFYSPARTTTLNDSFMTIARKDLKTFDNVFSSSILSICEENYPLDQYKNTLQMRYGDLAKCKVKIIDADTNTDLLGDASQFSADNWEFSTGAISPVSGDGREVVTDQDRKFGTDSAVLNTFNENIYIAKEFPVSLKSFEPYWLSFSYNVQSVGTNVKWGYRFITQQYKDDFAAQAEGKSIDKLTAYTNNNPYPTSEESEESFVVQGDLTGRVNRVIQTKLDNVIGVQIFLYSQSINSISRVTYQDLNLYNAYDSLDIDTASIIDSAREFDGSVILIDNLTLAKGQNVFGRFAKQDNLLKNDNYSFEKRLWDLNLTLEQNDCLPDHGGAIIGMKQTDESASDGSKSLVLDAKTHYACTKKSFPVNLAPDGNYVVTFDYNNTNGGKITSQLKVNGVSVNPGYEVVKVSSGEWQTYAIPFSLDPRLINASNVSSIELTLVSPSDGLYSVRNLFDNVGLYSVNHDAFNLDGAYFFASKRFNTVVGDSGVSNVVNPNRYSSKFDVKLEWTQDPIAVILDKPYSENYLINGTDNTYHYKLNNLTNLWLVGPDGSYELKDRGTSLLVSVRNISIALAVTLVLCSIFYSQVVALVLLVKKGTLYCFNGIKLVAMKALKFLRRFNSIIANRIVKVVIFKVLGTKDLSFDTLVSLRDRAIRSLEIMLRKIFSDILNNPIYVVAILIVGVLAVKFIGILYAPFIVIFIAWLTFKWDSRLLALAALLQLCVVPVLLILKFERYAEMFSISVYFFLVMTVVMQIIEYWIDKKKPKSK